MRFERLSNIEHPMYDNALELYRISFPSHEQREPISQTQILNDDEYCFSLIYDEGVFVGLILYWDAGSFIYVEHFCILPEMRNKSYGQRALELLGQNNKTVILEIDPPVDALSVHRKGFYERNGFIENPYPHVHPPYHKGNAGHDLVVMSYPAGITQAAYDAFKHYLDHHVMKDVF
ncbi:MAG: GNAT family N-acetyltransferase [Clostridia bacterium]|nr:GNAT family N-acetyltransferase [Clostridia bacterium]